MTYLVNKSSSLSGLKKKDIFQMQSMSLAFQNKIQTQQLFRSPFCPFPQRFHFSKKRVRVNLGYWITLIEFQFVY